MYLSISYFILSIVSCHHGEYGEPPRTVAAYVVHLLDKLESGLTGLSDKLEQSEGERISYDSFGVAGRSGIFKSTVCRVIKHLSML